MIRPHRQFSPQRESLESRDLTAVVIADLDTGAYQLPSWPPNYGLPPVTLYPYLMQEWDARGLAISPTTVGDTGGYGAHGTMMGGLAASYSLLRGSPVLVQPIVVGTMAGASSTAIGNSLNFVVAEQLAWPQHRFIVTLPWNGGYQSPAERQGRKLAARFGVPVFDSATFPPAAVPIPSLGTSGAAVIAAVNYSISTQTIYGRSVPRPSAFRSHR